jgi:nicotinamide-nucleotide amidase
MTSAEIIAIGTELLLGEIQDTNTRELAIFLRNNGINLYRSTIVGDNPNRIAKAIQESLSRADIVITTGGLGPTVDDPTRESVAAAIGRDIIFSEELWQQIQDRFKRFGRIATGNNKKQAYIPKGSIAVENLVGTAPAFIVELDTKVIISLPGVPRELLYLLQAKIQPYLKSKFDLLDIIKTKIIHVAGIGESSVDELIGDLESSINPTVGLSAHPGQIDIRITAKGTQESQVDEMLGEYANEIRSRLGDSVYGQDGDTLERIVYQQLSDKNWKVQLSLTGFVDEFRSKINSIELLPGEVQRFFLLDENHLQTGKIDKDLPIEGQDQKKLVMLSASLLKDKDKSNLKMEFISPDSNVTNQISYGGPPELSKLWAANQIIDFLRRNLTTQSKE